MSAFANYLALNHSIRQSSVDWVEQERMRIARGYEWGPASVDALKARAAEIRRDVEIVRAMRNFGRDE